MEFILNIEYGGLGDNLFYSPIPELLKKKYPDSKVYIFNSGNLRNKEINDLVWSKNPFIDGFTSKFKKPKKINLNKIFNENILSHIARQYTNVNNSHLEPKIYYKPKKNILFDNKTLIDLNYVSFVGAISHLKVNKYIDQFKNKIFVNKPDWVTSEGEAVNDCSIEEYVDMIYSSKTFICLTSGSATLASSIGKGSICIYGYGQNKIFHHSKIHKYIEISPKLSIVKKSKSLYLKLKNRIKYI